MRITLAQPDVSIPLYVAISSLVGAVGGIGATIAYVAGLTSMCAALPVFSLSSALVAALPWSLRRTNRRLPGTRAAMVLMAFAVLCAIEAIRCRALA